MNGDKSKFSGTAYRKSLTYTLDCMVMEDTTEHGRLLTMKNQLIEMTEEKKLTMQQLTLLHAKDILNLRNLDVNKKDSYDELFRKPPSEQEIKTFVKNRMKQSHFNRPDLFDSGSSKLADSFKKIIDSLVKKDGIVPDDLKNTFRKNLLNWKPDMSGQELLPKSQKQIMSEQKTKLTYIHTLVSTQLAKVKPVSQAIIDNISCDTNRRLLCNFLMLRMIQRKVVPTNQVRVVANEIGNLCCTYPHLKTKLVEYLHD